MLFVLGRLQPFLVVTDFMILFFPLFITKSRPVGNFRHLRFGMKPRPRACIVHAPTGDRISKELLFTFNSIGCFPPLSGACTLFFFSIIICCVRAMVLRVAFKVCCKFSVGCVFGFTGTAILYIGTNNMHYATNKISQSVVELHPILFLAEKYST